MSADASRCTVGRVFASAPGLVVSLDAPDEGARVEEFFDVRGWAIAQPPYGACVVEVRLDGERHGMLRTGIDRPDVVAAYDGEVPMDCGFAGSVNVANRSPGSARLVVTVTTATGASKTFERRIEIHVPARSAPQLPEATDRERIGFRMLREGQRDESWPWFREHYEQAAGEIADFLGGDGISLEGKAVADVGCGDGIIDLGLVHRAKPARLVGFDLEPVDTDSLLAEARAEGVAHKLPAELEFRTCSVDLLPCESHQFDCVISWSAFEHVARPIRVMKEIRRIMRPDGILFLQIWPFYYSEHGSHLWPWYPSGFAALMHSEDEILQTLRENPRGRPEDTAFIADEFRNLNRMTVDDLQRTLLAAGLFVTKFEFMCSATRIPPELARYPLSYLGISGIKLMAVVA